MPIIIVYPVVTLIIAMLLSCYII